MNSYGEIALIEASDNGHIEVVKLLIEAGADVNARDHGTTALMEASIDGYLEIVKMLIEAEADLNIQYSGVIYLDSDKDAISHLKREAKLYGVHNLNVFVVRIGKMAGIY